MSVSTVGVYSVISWLHQVVGRPGERKSDSPGNIRQNVEVNDFGAPDQRIGLWLLLVKDVHPAVKASNSQLVSFRIQSYSIQRIELWIGFYPAIFKRAPLAMLKQESIAFLLHRFL